MQEGCFVRAYRVTFARAVGVLSFDIIEVGLAADCECFERFGAVLIFPRGVEFEGTPGGVAGSVTKHALEVCLDLV